MSMWFSTWELLTCDKNIKIMYEIFGTWALLHKGTCGLGTCAGYGITYKTHAYIHVEAIKMSMWI